ncbi:MAG: hypothetical protein IKO06_01430 [Alphaproteobacteria bacterium]|nr:hypothetical protein [Alphaproteobacteria bacterium]
MAQYKLNKKQKPHNRGGVLHQCFNSEILQNIAEEPINLKIGRKHLQHKSADVRQMQQINLQYFCR